MVTERGQGDEPTNWELMRGLNEVKLAIQEQGKTNLPIAVYTADKQGVDDRFKRAEARVGDLEKNALDSEKQRRATRLAISLAIAAPIITIIVGILAHGALI